MKKFLLAFLLLIPYFSLSQTLKPGETNFTVSSIYLPEGSIHLIGNTSRLTVYWKAYYSDGSERDIGVVCFLNCDERYNTTCPGPMNCSCELVQNCSVFSPPGKGACSFINPVYNDLNTTNFVSCRFYDPLHEEIVKGVINKTFVPVNFTSEISSVTPIVGETFTVQILVKNYGLFDDDYEIISFTSTPTSLYIYPNTSYAVKSAHGDRFEPHTWEELGPGSVSHNVKAMVIDAGESSVICLNASSVTMKSIGSPLFKPEEPCMIIKSDFQTADEPTLIVLFSFLIVLFLNRERLIKGL